MTNEDIALIKKLQQDRITEHIGIAIAGIVAAVVGIFFYERSMPGSLLDIVSVALMGGGALLAIFSAAILVKLRKWQKCIILAESIPDSLDIECISVSKNLVSIFCKSKKCKEVVAQGYALIADNDEGGKDLLRVEFPLGDYEEKCDWCSKKTPIPSLFKSRQDAESYLETLRLKKKQGETVLAQRVPFKNPVTH